MTKKEREKLLLALTGIKDNSITKLKTVAERDAEEADKASEKAKSDPGLKSPDIDFEDILLPFGIGSTVKVALKKLLGSKELINLLKKVKDAPSKKGSHKTEWWEKGEKPGKIIKPDVFDPTAKKEKIPSIPKDKQWWGKGEKPGEVIKPKLLDPTAKKEKEPFIPKSERWWGKGEKPGKIIDPNAESSQSKKVRASLVPKDKRWWEKGEKPGRVIKPTRDVDISKKGKDTTPNSERWWEKGEKPGRVIEPAELIAPVKKEKKIIEKLITKKKISLRQEDIPKEITDITNMKQARKYGRNCNVEKYQEMVDTLKNLTKREKLHKSLFRVNRQNEQYDTGEKLRKTNIFLRNAITEYKIFNEKR